MVVSECCLITLLPYFFRKIYLYFSIGNCQPRKPALCQLYQHTFVPDHDRLNWGLFIGLHCVTENKFTVVGYNFGVGLLYMSRF